jgi:dihydroflavonol-4-reductase
MNALVTGATGFLGSHLCRRLLKDGFDVTALCRPTSRTYALDGLPVTKKIGDVTDRASVDEAVIGNDYVFHAAAHGTYWGRHRKIQNLVNIEGTRNVVEACVDSGVKRLVFVSSITAIGLPPEPEKPANEEFPFNLESSSLNYHISKKRAEEIVLAAIAKGLETVIVNPANIWGPHGERFRVADHVEKVIGKRTIPYFKGGICVVHVDDVVDGIMAAFKNGRAGERYILGGQNLTLRAIAELAVRRLDQKASFVPVPNAVTWAAAALFESVALATGRRPRITYVTHQLASRFQYYDSEKAKRELGFNPRNFDAILDECIAFIRARNEKSPAKRLSSL